MAKASSKKCRVVKKPKAPVKKSKITGKSEKTPGLVRRKFSKIKQEFHDIDYAHKLNDKEKELMSAFLDETLGTNFKRNKKKIYKSKSKQQELYRENNHRNVDIFANLRASGRLMYIDPNWVLEQKQEELIASTGMYDDQAKEEDTLLTKRQFIALLNSGAEIPDDMLMFYFDYYDL